MGKTARRGKQTQGSRIGDNFLLLFAVCCLLFAVVVVASHVSVMLFLSQSICFSFSFYRFLLLVSAQLLTLSLDRPTNTES